MSTAILARSTTDWEVISMPIAQLTGNTKVLTPGQVWSPTDGANLGKHKLGNGVDVFDDLAYIEDSAGGAAAWGTISGTLSAQTDLQTVLNTKMESVTLPNTYGTFGNAGGTAINPSFPLQSEAQMRTIAQIGHGFTQPQALKVEAGGGGVNALAQGDDAGNSSFVGFVFEVASANQYRLITSGYANIFTGLTAGSYYYLDPSTPGAITATPNAFGPVLKAVSTTGGYVLSNAAAVALFTSQANTRASLGLPNVYTALLGQSTTDPPVATSELNQLGGTPIYTYVDVGVYTLTITGAFPNGRTKVFMSNAQNDTAVGVGGGARITNDTISIRVVDCTGTFADDILSDAAFRIEVWP